MSSLIISTLTFILLMAGSCSSQPAAPPKTWSISLTTSGGFTGLGQGDMSLSSNNRFKCTQKTSPQSRKNIEGHLPSDQFKLISNAVDQLDPKGWNKPGLNVSAPDAFGYKFDYKVGTEDDQVFTVQWYDNTADQLPDDLKKMSDALLQTLKTSCGGTS
jgi:hypothetical protein